MDRLKTSELKEAKQALLEMQGYVCPICYSDLSGVKSQHIHVDHSHTNGQIRAALCSTCNQMEGQIQLRSNRAKRDRTPLEWLKSMIEYIEEHEENPSGVYHPKHRTEEEKRLARNKKARIRAKKKKEALR